MVLQDMDLKNPVLAIMPRDKSKTITKDSTVRVMVGRVRVWVKVGIRV